LVGTWQQLAKLSSQLLIVSGQQIDPIQSAQNLGVTLDDQLTMDAHVRNTFGGCFLST
jgi:hypothetical protein